MLMVLIEVPEHLTWEAGVITALGMGFTSTVAVIGVPLQPASTGVMVKVIVTGAVPLLISVPEIFPDPDVLILPVMDGLSLTQLNEAPVVGLDNVIVVTGVPVHTCCDTGLTIAVATGFTVTVATTGVPAQP